MTWLSAVPWGETFRPGVPISEIILRGSLMYLFLFLLLRVVLKRQAGTLALSDLLLIVLLADAAQNGMSAGYKSLTDGILLVSVLVFWNFAIDWLGYRVPLLGRIVHPPPLPLIRDGRLIRQNMRHELVTREELLSQLREQGIEDVAAVKTAHMEGDGRISVVKKGGASEGARDRRGL